MLLLHISGPLSPLHFLLHSIAFPSSSSPWCLLQHHHDHPHHRHPCTCAFSYLNCLAVLFRAPVEMREAASVSHCSVSLSEAIWRRGGGEMSEARRYGRRWGNFAEEEEHCHGRGISAKKRELLWFARISLVGTGCLVAELIFTSSHLNSYFFALLGSSAKNILSLKPHI